MTQTSAESLSGRHLVRVLARMLAAHPTWLLAHAQAYVDVGLEQAQQAAAAWQRRLLLLALAGACAGLAVTLAGIALMLWAVTPDLASQRVWLLMSVPLLPALLALAFHQAAQRVRQPPCMAELKQQWSADLAVLHEVATP